MATSALSPQESEQESRYNELHEEIERLHKLLAPVGRTKEDCALYAPLTLCINKLKKQKNAIILTHNYQRAEIIFGVGDVNGDSLALAKKAAGTSADIIVFCGVHFMAETAKILNPDKKVLLPDLEAGCSLASSITADDVINLKKQHPDAPVVTYVNTSAQVKAASDIVCTSANALNIIKKLPDKKIIFLPDEYMAKNLAKQTNKEIISWNGKCIVHEQFKPWQIDQYRQLYPEGKVLAHTECSPEVIAKVDVAGGTSDMISYIKNSPADKFMIVTECGMGEMLQVQHPSKHFTTPCTICPHMKTIHLENVLIALEQEIHEITVPTLIAEQAKKALDRMLALS
ncbi:quinolinate synthase NadA [Candidatus Woesearchaeota archaeon]|nr:quinolinate synthase NadA [Candidatus Woesearchaeota archaeon]